jgi:hypothetical protein
VSEIVISISSDSVFIAIFVVSVTMIDVSGTGEVIVDSSTKDICEVEVIRLILPKHASVSHDALPLLIQIETCANKRIKLNEEKVEYTMTTMLAS